MSDRFNVHLNVPAPHAGCSDPSNCDCDCLPCKRAWEAAGRPTPTTAQMTPEQQRKWLSHDRPNAPPKYRIEAENLVDLFAKLVYLMKLERDEKPDAHVNVMTLELRDRSKATVKLGKGAADPRYRAGIEIDGARLG